MIKTVIFDIDSTLYSYEETHPVAFEELKKYAAAEFGWTSEEFEKLHKEAHAEQRTLIGDTASIHNRLIRYQLMLEHKHLPLEPHVLNMEDIYWNTLIQTSVPEPGAVEVMRTLKEKGFRIGIGTDMTARIQFQKLTHLGLLPYVDFMVTSEETGAEKPDPALFRRCVAKGECEACECIFVGDNLRKDYYGATGIGMHAVWYRPMGEISEDIDVPQITDLRKLLQIIETIK